ncbi:glutathione S-transferase family protein [Phenylobacterium sp.]|uniref:glutathione S-transferase family protein n=1 Tax=Phenylobacterium sp. TaxID=1871053 RepID=UPI0035B097B2
MELVIGTKKWSTWSMRPWLVLKRVGAPFDETLIELRQEGATQAAIAGRSPSGLVPALKVDGAVIWDSLAICEFLAERFPDAGLWPADPLARALARSAASEMHSGFQSLRGECPMALDMEPHHPSLSPATEANVRRIVRLWSDLLGRSGGPFLCGGWGIVDAFFTPVASRFHTYCVKLSDYGDTGLAGAYCERLLETPEFKAWAADA